MLDRTFLEKSRLTIVLLFVFLMPLKRAFLPPLLALWFLSWLLSGDFRSRFKELKNNPVFLLPVVFYLLHIAGLFYTENYREGRFDLEVKFSLLLLPLLVFSDKTLFENNKNSILFSFFLGNLAAAALCFGNYFLNEKKELLYTDLSLFLHNSYASMYVLFAIIFLVHFMWTKRTSNSSGIEKLFGNNLIQLLFAVPACAILLYFIYFLSSRTGILAAILVPGFLVLFFMFLARKWLLLTAALVVAISLLVVVPQKNERFKPLWEFLKAPAVDSLNIVTYDDTRIRYNIATESVKVIRENFLTGVGTGDVKDALAEKYKQRKYLFLSLYPDPNAHNQFLETFIGLGIPGIVILLLMIFLPLYHGLKRKNVLLIAFFLIIILNFLFESMLNRQAGVLFFSFFFSLLLAGERLSTKQNRDSSAIPVL